MPSGTIHLGVPTLRSRQRKHGPKIFRGGAPKVHPWEQTLLLCLPHAHNPVLVFGCGRDSRWNNADISYWPEFQQVHSSLLPPGIYCASVHRSIGKHSWLTL